MMAKKSERKQLIERINERRDNLQRISKNLKTKFVGIDKIIDSIIENINVWYVLPELIRRPVIINLWGMTGVGKTDLVRSLIFEMEMTDKFVEIQMKNKSNDYWSKTVQGYLDNSSIELEEPGVLLLDEIQRYRTIDQNGIELHDHDFQDLWMLLSDGKFSNDSNAKESLLGLLFADAYYADMQDEEEDTPTVAGKKKKKKKKKRNYHRSYYSAIQLKKKLKIKESIDDIMKWTEDKKSEILLNAMKNQSLYQGDSYDKLLIFISGNLDEVYKMAGNTDDAEIDADIFHDFSAKINMMSVKYALRKRFKPEQISRFGNTHVIYPSLSRGSYEEIIKRKIKEITTDVYERHQVKISIDQTVYDFVYRNGVFPAQGVRPVLSTILSTIANSIPMFLLAAIEHEENEFSVKYENKRFSSKIGIETFEYLIEGEIDKIRKSKNDEQRTITAVHEAGHSIAYADLFKLTPTQIVANSSSDNMGGYIGLHTMVSSKEILENQVVVLMAGMAAEEIVFGEQSRTSGSSQDILTATTIASDYIREYGMDGYASYIRNPYTSQLSAYNFDISESNAKIENMLQTQKKRATELLAQNKGFLIKIIDALLADGTIDLKEFKKIASKHGVDIEIMKPKDHLCKGYTDKLKEFKK